MGICLRTDIFAEQSVAVDSRLALMRAKEKMKQLSLISFIWCLTEVLLWDYFVLIFIRRNIAPRKKNTFALKIGEKKPNFANENKKM